VLVQVPINLALVFSIGMAFCGVGAKVNSFNVKDISEDQASRFVQEAPIISMERPVLSSVLVQSSIAPAGAHRFSSSHEVTCDTNNHRSEPDDDGDASDYDFDAIPIPTRQIAMFPDLDANED